MSNINTCSECGKENVQIYHETLCYDCYAIIWNAGFEATTDWGAKIAHGEFISDLNESLNEKERTLKIIKNIIYGFEPSKWYCDDCDFVYVDKDDEIELSAEEIFAKLRIVCPKCGRKGKITRNYLGEK